MSDPRAESFAHVTWIGHVPFVVPLPTRHDHDTRFWRLFVEGALRYPWTWLTEGGEATSIWIPPGGTDLAADQEERLADIVAADLGPNATDYLELLARFDAAHPRTEPHMYLALLRTHPDDRRNLRVARPDALLRVAHRHRELELRNALTVRRVASPFFRPVTPGRPKPDSQPPNEGATARVFVAHSMTPVDARRWPGSWTRWASKPSSWPRSRTAAEPSSRSSRTR